MITVIMMLSRVDRMNQRSGVGRQKDGPLWTGTSLKEAEQPVQIAPRDYS